MIKAITFDLDGVYFTEDSFKKLKSIFPTNNSNPDFVEHVLKKSDEVMNFKKGIMSETDYWNFVNQSFGQNLSIEQITNLLMEAYSVNQNVVDYVKKVRSEGVKTCICTNNFPTRINALNKKFNFLSDFDVQVFSYDVGINKPDTKIFQTLIEKSGVLPSELFYADDNQGCVDSAISVGINAITYTNFENFTIELVKLGVLFK